VHHARPRRPDGVGDGAGLGAPPEANEVETFKKKGLDIARHRQRMLKEDLDTRFIVKRLARELPKNVAPKHVEDGVSRAAG
jgi:hypothetical protein